MSLWKLINRRTNNVSSRSDVGVAATDGVSRGSNLIEESSSSCMEPLPDLIANLQLPNTEMMSIRDYHYPEMGDGRMRRRDARHPPVPVTPQGIGAAPQGLGAAPLPTALSPSVSGNSGSGLGGGGGGGGGWRYSQQHQWTSQADTQGLSGMSSAVGLGANCGMSLENDGARLRSISSEPRGPIGSNGDRRVRCSSATRSRQHRHCPPPGERHSTMSTTVPPPNSPPPPHVSGSHQPQSPTAGAYLSSAGANSLGGGLLARLAGCHETLESGRDSGDMGSAYGYQVSDLEALLTRASPSHPANLPMVVRSNTRLHNMRRTTETSLPNQTPVRPYLSLGAIVNAVFKTRDWLYVRTAHGAEGYVPYHMCLPLGILPPPRGTNTMAPGSGEGGAWESHHEMLQGVAAGVQLSGVQVTQGTTMMGGTNGLEAAVQTRGRSRGRRRQMCPDSCNQTDTQKLQPRGRSISESRTPREILDAPGSVPVVSTTDHVVI